MNLQTYPYRSRRSAVLAGNGIVATSQPLAAQAGLAVLRRGGNAVDAAIATAAALTVVEPTSNGIGGDAFALVWDGERLHGLNGSGRAPAALDAGQLRERGHRAFPERGWSAVTVPGVPDAWETLRERFGSLSAEDLLAPAAELAEQGFPVSPVIAGLWSNAYATFVGTGDPALAGWEELFTRAGATPACGQVWRSQAHADCLRGLARRGLRDFYTGEIAERIVSFAARTGGALDADDLAGHASEWVQPIEVGYRGHQVWEIPPNAQGIAALQALAMLEGTAIGDHAHAGEAAWHLQIEAMKLAFADAYRYVADPSVVPVPVAGLLAPGYIAERRAEIADVARVPHAGVPSTGGTVYLCTADRDGAMVSYIQSNYSGFGSGVVIPGTGIALHNRAACFSLEAGHPNEAAGGKRPRHTIIPGFLTRDGKPLGPFGVMGAGMQPQGHVQVISSMLDHGLNPQAALDAPRWRIGEGLELAVEPEVDGSVIEALGRRGHQVRRVGNPARFGRGQIILRLDSGAYAAGSEPRADGVAVGW